MKYQQECRDFVDDDGPVVRDAEIAAGHLRGPRAGREQ